MVKEVGTGASDPFATSTPNAIGKNRSEKEHHELIPQFNLTQDLTQDPDLSDQYRENIAKTFTSCQPALSSDSNVDNTMGSGNLFNTSGTQPTGTSSSTDLAKRDGEKHDEAKTDESSDTGGRKSPAEPAGKPITLTENGNLLTKILV